MELGDAIYSVGRLTRLIKELFWQTESLREVAVRGELSNCRQHASGHVYFTLKDDSASLRGVMFRQEAGLLRFQPQSGLQVVAYGRVGIYERDGTYQLYAQRMEPDGLGAAHLALEQLKAALEKEGWFAPERKRPLPQLPRAVGVVTGLGSAALADILKIARRRYPSLRIVVSGALVQGQEAPASIARSLERIARVPGVDVVIVGRGGGSREELWAFNHEQVVRSMGNCPLPVVSAVGHQSDVTLADLVADVRAATPSHAAELVVPLRSQLELGIAQQALRLHMAIKRRCQLVENRRASLAGRPVLRRPLEVVYQRAQRQDELEQRLVHATQGLWRMQKARALGLWGRLDALNPLGVLARGFSVCRDEAGQVIRSVTQSISRDRVSVQLSDGRLYCRVEQRGAEPAWAGGTLRKEERNDG